MQRRFPLRLTLAGLLLILASHGAHAQLYNRFGPANGVLKGSTSTPQTTAAAASDIVGLWSGTCDMTTFLRADGSCAVPAGTGVTSVALTMPSGFTVAGSPITGSGTFAVSTTLSGVLKGNGSGFVTATSADVIGLWTGTCDSTTFLRGDGTCQTGGGGSGSVTSIAAGTGITASPASPITTSGTLSVDQSFSPTWTGTHTFTAQSFMSNAATSFNPLAFCANGQTSTNRCFGFRIGGGGDLQLDIADDTGTPGHAIFDATRSGTAVSSLTIGNATDNPSILVAGSETITSPVVASPSDRNLQIQTITGTGDTRLGVLNNSAGDAYLDLDTIGKTNWSIGNRRSDGAFIISSALDFSLPRLSISSTGNVIIDAPNSGTTLIATGPADNSGNAGDFRGEFVVRNQAGTLNYLLIDTSGNITAPDAASVPWPKTAACWITNTSTTPAINVSRGTVSCSGVTKNSTGNYTVSFGAGFSNRPMCTFGATPSGNPSTWIANGPSGTGSSVNIVEANTSAAADGDFMMICTGT